MIQLLFFKEVGAPKQMAPPVGDRAAQIAKLKKAVSRAEDEVYRAEENLEEAEGELEAAEDALQNFIDNGTCVDSELAGFAQAILGEHYLSWAAREIIEGIIYDRQPPQPLLLFAQNYGWEIPREVREAVKNFNR